LYIICYYCNYIDHLTGDSSSRSSNSSGVLLAVILPVIAVITAVGIAVLIVIIFVKKKSNNSASAALVCETDDISSLTRNGIGFENPAYISTDEISHDKDTVTSTDKVLCDKICHTTEDIKLQPNPADGTSKSDKVVMGNNPAYKVFK